MVISSLDAARPVELLLADAEALLAEGARQSAGDLYRQVLRQDPANARARFGLADVAFAQGLSGQGIEELFRLLRQHPDNVDARLRLADAFRAAGKPEAAIEQGRAALERDPLCGAAWSGMGKALLQLRDWQGAADALGRAVALGPTDAESCNNLGNALKAMTSSRALSAYRFAARLDPGIDNAVHMMAALSGAATSRAPAGYVTALFDAYADGFDEELTKVLGYRGPELVAAAAAEILPADAKDLTVVDLGCGTGLCGPHLRRWASTLIGVDLSGGMLRQALRRGVYDDLYQDDIVGFLEGWPQPIDLLVAADVFIYVGDLAPVFGLAGQRLAVGGMLIFTIETAAPSGGTGPADPQTSIAETGFILRPSGRFAHSVGYVEKTAAAAGLQVVRHRPVTVRTDFGRPIASELFVVRRL